MTSQDRILTNIVVVENCWEWLGSTDSSGYGSLSFRGKCASAHTLSYRAFRGEIPAGLEIDHLCRNRRCVNPWHMEPVTHHANIMRGDLVKTVCVRGHALVVPPEKWKRKSKWCPVCTYGARRERRAAAKKEKSQP